MYRAIMVPLSDWRTDSRAVSAAVQLARRSAARLHIVHVRKGAWTRAAGRAEDQALDAAVGWAGDELNESVSFRMIRSELKGRRGGRTAEELTEYALANDIELTVMTRQRHSVERVLHGSVGERLLGLLDAPILFVPARPRQFRVTKCHVLVPLDGSGAAEIILPEAANLASFTGGSLTLLHVVSPDPHEVADASLARETHAQRYLRGVAERVGAGGIPVDTLTLAGDRVASVLHDAATAEHTDVIALATRPRTSHFEFITDSVTARVLSSLDTGLLVRQQVIEAGVNASELIGMAPRYCKL